MHDHERRNSNLDLAVRYGIILDAEFGALKAWMFMFNNGVSESVILRVLLQPQKRRDTDQVVFEIANSQQALHRNPEAARAVFGIRPFKAAD
jgi:hypothetical protein